MPTGASRRLSACMPPRVVVKGGQRMLARAPAGTKKWHIWSTYEDLESSKLQQQRRRQQGSQGTWLVDVSGSLMR
jgi:hypothetical protein